MFIISLTMMTEGGSNLELLSPANSHLFTLILQSPENPTKVKLSLDDIKNLESLLKKARSIAQE